MLMQARVWDPLYGRVSFDKFEFDIISLPEIQRLRNVRMCNINSYLVTGASEISRFEHTIGVLRLTQEWLSTHKVTRQESNDLTAAAILHDMQTGPFGHSLQYVLEDNAVEGDFVHEDVAHGSDNSYHQDLLANASFCGRPFGARELLGVHWDKVSELVKGGGALGALVSGTMDLDNIDNVVRLAYHVGVAGSADANVAIDLARDMNISSGVLSFSVTTIDAIVRWQSIRQRLYNLLLLDWAEFSAKAMLTKAIEIAVSKGLIGSDSWVHTDSELFATLERTGTGDAQEVSELIKRIKTGELYEPLVMLKSGSIEKYEYFCSANVKHDFDQQILDYAKNELGINIKILTHFILDKGKTRRAVKIKLRETSEIVEIGENSRTLLIGVFLSKGGVSEANLVRLKQKISTILTQNDVNDLADIEDPMGQPNIKNSLGEQFVLL